MQIISISNVSRWLRRSDIYSNIADNYNEDDGDFEIPVSYGNLSNERAYTLNECISLFNTSRYWGADFPPTFFSVCLIFKEDMILFLENLDDNGMLHLLQIILL